MRALILISAVISASAFAQVQSSGCPTGMRCMGGNLQAKDAGFTGSVTIAGDAGIKNNLLVEGDAGIKGSFIVYGDAGFSKHIVLEAIAGGVANEIHSKGTGLNIAALDSLGLISLKLRNRNGTNGPIIDVPTTATDDLADIVFDGKTGNNAINMRHENRVGGQVYGAIPEWQLLTYNGSSYQTEFACGRGGCMAATGLKIGASGTEINACYRANATALDFALTGPTACSDLTVSLTNAADGMTCTPGALNAAIVTGASYTCWVSAANTVTIRMCCDNGAAGTCNPSSQNFRPMVCD